MYMRKHMIVILLILFILGSFLWFYIMDQTGGSR